MTEVIQLVGVRCVCPFIHLHHQIFWDVLMSGHLVGPTRTVVSPDNVLGGTLVVVWGKHSLTEETTDKT